MEASPLDRDALVSKALTVLLAVLGLAIFLSLLQTAWMCDDAYISYRSVRNAVDGLGLTYNPVERVQSFTHPLWALLLIPLFAITGEIYFTALILSMCLSMAAFYTLYRIAGQTWATAVVLLAAICSHAFMDYSTSGLENPLTHFLMGLFLLEWLGRKRLGRLALLASLAVITRQDSALLYLPVMLQCFWEVRSWRAARTVLLHAMPFFAWEAFSILYYGFPFPNTAYAKLNTGISAADLWGQGLNYLAFTLQYDTVTALVILGGMVAGFSQKRLRPLAAGTLLYVLYTTKVGGDFMAGRFLTAPFFMSLAILGLYLNEMKLRGLAWSVPVAGAAVLLAGMVMQQPALLEPGPTERNIKEVINENGIADERSFYYPETGLRNRISDLERPVFRWGALGQQIKADSLALAASFNMGFTGWYASADNHLLDLLGLTDPLLARLPMVYDPNWRTGHYVRAVPKGYPGSILLPEPTLEDPDMNEYDRRLRLVTRGEIFDWNRIKQIARFNLGMNEHLIDREAYRFPIRQHTTLAVTESREGPRFIMDEWQGLEVDFEGKRTVSKLGLRASFGGEIQALLLHEGQVVWAKAFRLNPEDYPEGTVLMDAAGVQADRAYIYPLAHLGSFIVDWVWVEE